MPKALIKLFFIASIGATLQSCLGDYQTRLEEGYLNHLSFHPTDSMNLYFSSDVNANMTLRLFDLTGDEVFKESGVVRAQAPSTDKPYREGYGFELTKQINTPNLSSGIYLWENIIPFIIRSDYNKRVAVVIPTNSWIGANNKGGWSLNSALADTTAIEPEFSILRPMPLDGLNKIKPFLNYLKGLNLDDMYLADSDLDNYDNIDGAQLLILFGESPFWTRQARENISRFVEAGRNVLVLSHNTMKWQARYGSNGSLICYGSISNDTISDPLLKTGLWRNSTLQFPVLEQIGSAYQLGGSNLNSYRSNGGLTILNHNSKLLQGKKYEAGDVIRLPGSSYDGSPVTYTCDACFPNVTDFTNQWYRYDLIASDRLSDGNQTGCFLALQPTESSGVIVSLPSSSWTSSEGLEGPDKREVKRITETCIRKLMHNQEIFD